VEEKKNSVSSWGAHFLERTGALARCLEMVRDDVEGCSDAHDKGLTGCSCVLGPQVG